ncbi:MAG: NADH-quinone oxidoreductase subunit [Actinomycetota bacterium]|jgi:NADH-quinone oxidoreductase subunit E|nr:NADH-quinone oxidoreductase subunit [Actinomycetota bacterium]
MAIFEGSVLDDARAVIARYPKGGERSALMPLLYLAQAVDGRVTNDALVEIGKLLGITTAEVEAVATFYSMYRLRPTGTHVVNVCTNLACALRGAKDVYEEAHRAAEMEHGQEVSDDGVLTLHEEECLGLCDFAPAVQINFADHDNVSPQRIRELIMSLREGSVPEPARGPAMKSFRHASRVLAGFDDDLADGAQ